MNRERLEQIKALKQQGEQKSKDKSFDKMSAKERNELIEIALKMLGLLK